MNYYSLILASAIVGGLLATVWGWKLTSRGRAIKNWPTVEGRIEESQVDEDEQLPRVIFSYMVDRQVYRCRLEYAGGAAPMPEEVRACLEKYPVNSPVEVHYDPAEPQQATLEPGAASGDWFIIATGVAIALFALFALLFGGS